MQAKCKKRNSLSGWGGRLKITWDDHVKSAKLEERLAYSLSECPCWACRAVMPVNKLGEFGDHNLMTYLSQPVTPKIWVWYSSRYNYSNLYLYLCYTLHVVLNCEILRHLQRYLIGMTKSLLKEIGISHQWQFLMSSTHLPTLKTIPGAMQTGEYP